MCLKCHLLENLDTVLIVLIFPIFSLKLTRDKPDSSKKLFP